MTSGSASPPCLPIKHLAWRCAAISPVMTAAWSRPRPYPPDATKDLRPHKLKLLGLWRGRHYMELRDGNLTRSCPLGQRPGPARGKEKGWERWRHSESSAAVGRHKKQ